MFDKVLYWSSFTAWVVALVCAGTTFDVHAYAIVCYIVAALAVLLAFISPRTIINYWWVKYPYHSKRQRWISQAWDMLWILLLLALTLEIEGRVRFVWLLLLIAWLLRWVGRWIPDKK